MASKKRSNKFYVSYDFEDISQNLEYNISPNCQCYICNLISSKKKDDTTRMIRSAAKRCDRFSYYHDEYHKLCHSDDAEKFLDFLREMGLKVDSYIKKRTNKK